VCAICYVYVLKVPSLSLSSHQAQQVWTHHLHGNREAFQKGKGSRRASGRASAVQLPTLVCYRSFRQNGNMGALQEGKFMYARAPGDTENNSEHTCRISSQPTTSLGDSRPSRPHTLRSHLQTLDPRPRQIYTRPNPPNAGLNSTGAVECGLH
jgi:hypothetical protein